MNKITTMVALAFTLSACSAHAHVRVPLHPPKPHHSSAHHHHRGHHPPAHNAHPPGQSTVRAWVWIRGYYNAHNTWTRGHWELRTVPRYLLSRPPHTYVRYVQGRGMPAPPHRGHR